MRKKIHEKLTWRVHGMLGHYPRKKLGKAEFFFSYIYVCVCVYSWNGNFWANNSIESPGTRQQRKEAEPREKCQSWRLKAEAKGYVESVQL